MSDGDASGHRPRDDPERAAVLRAVAAEIRGEGSEREQLAAVVQRVSDLYDPDEETTPAEIYRSARTILRVKERGGMPDRNGS